MVIVDYINVNADIVYAWKTFLIAQLLNASSVSFAICIRLLYNLSDKTPHMLLPLGTPLGLAHQARRVTAISSATDSNRISSEQRFRWIKILLFLKFEV